MNRVRHDVVEVPGPERHGEESVGPRVIRTNELLAKAMSVDEAVMQMDLMNNDFLVFTNASTREVNVVYRRKDGHYGLIEASAVKQSPEI
jgi:putative sigma-54 modulation protein